MTRKVIVTVAWITELLTMGSRRHLMLLFYLDDKDTVPGKMTLSWTGTFSASANAGGAPGLHSDLDPAWLRPAFAKHEGHAKTLRRKDE